MKESDIRLLMEISPDREIRPGWQRGVEIQRTRRNIKEIAETAGIKYDKIEYAVLDYGIAYERAGFRNGFRFAAQILSECMNTSLNTDNIPGLDLPDTLPFES